MSSKIDDSDLSYIETNDPDYIEPGTQAVVQVNKRRFEKNKHPGDLKKINILVVTMIGLIIFMTVYFV